jgi:hypothetical protein
MTTQSPWADPDLLRDLLQRFRAGDADGLQAALDACGGPATPEAVVGALCLGGTDFAARIAARSAVPPLPDAYVAVLEALEATLGPAAGEEHTAQVAGQLIERFGLAGTPQTLLRDATDEFLIVAGPLEHVPETARAAMARSDWPLALRGLQRCRDELQASTPRGVYGMAALCLHKLGRYAEADQWVAQGLGAQALPAPKPVFTQDQLLQRWGGRREPVVSIICTAYNHERYIESAIRGFLSQDCPFPFEILIHDDASKDGTQRIVRDWQQRYPDLIFPVLQTQNQWSRGVRPFELLLARARGEFVATCEGDDYWVDPAKLSRQVGFLQEHPEFSCSAHNYYHFVEMGLTVKPWVASRADRVLSQRHLMGLARLLWLPTLVFRKRFSAMPPERALSPLGDQFLTSYLGTLGPCMMFDSLLGAVRRENAFSAWSPLSEQEKERVRVKTWKALLRLHQRLGQHQAVADLRAKIAASRCAHDPLTELAEPEPCLMEAAT